MTDTQRVNIGKGAPAAYAALVKLDKEVTALAGNAGLQPLLVELLKIRVSQINGCAFCLRYHTRDALKLGESTDRLAVLSAWAETGYFSDRERAALALTEAVTRIWDGQVPDHVYAQVSSVLSDAEIAAVSWVAVTINAFSRVAITSRYPVGA